VKLKPYPEYRDSGLPWLGEISAHWEVRRNGRLFAQRVETGFPDLPILEVSLNTGVQVRNLDTGARKQIMSDFDRYKRAVRGDIAYNMMRMWQGAVGLAPVDGLVSPAYVVARPYPEAESRYYSYLFRTDAYMNEVNKFSRGIVTDRNRLYWEEFKQMPSAFPPPEEQRKIADFLDGHGHLVRRLIIAKRRLIELLNEQKQAIIHRAVTRGLDPDAPTKPTGLDWLPEVPEHWEVVRFKARVGFQEGPGIMAADFRDHGVPLLRISCLSGEEATLDGCNFLDPAMVSAKWRHFAVQPGDYLLSASANTGAVSRATEVVAGAIPYPGILRLWARSSGINMEYIRHFIGSQAFIDQIDTAKSGVGIEHFGPTHLKRMWLCLPPKGEQKQIVRSIREQSLQLDRAIDRAQREIDLIREYRTRLISDVVTGKLDVRGADLPELNAGEVGVKAGLDGLESVVTASSPDPEEVLHAYLRHQ
jgi:type I restriction enzyme S subunit